MNSFHIFSAFDFSLICESLKANRSIQTLDLGNLSQAQLDLLEEVRDSKHDFIVVMPNRIIGDVDDEVAVSKKERKEWVLCDSCQRVKKKASCKRERGQEEGTRSYTPELLEYGLAKAKPVSSTIQVGEQSLNPCPKLQDNAYRMKTIDHKLYDPIRPYSQLTDQQPRLKVQNLIGRAETTLQIEPNERRWQACKVKLHSANASQSSLEPYDDHGRILNKEKKRLRGSLNSKDWAFSHTILPRDDNGLHTAANPSSFKHDQITGGSVSINPSVYSRSSRKRSSERIDSLGTVNVDLFTDQSIKKRGYSGADDHD